MLFTGASASSFQANTSPPPGAGQATTQASSEVRYRLGMCGCEPAAASGTPSDPSPGANPPFASTCVPRAMFWLRLYQSTCAPPSPSGSSVTPAMESALTASTPPLGHAGSSTPALVNRWSLSDFCVELNGLAQPAMKPSAPEATSGSTQIMVASASRSEG